MTLPEMLRTVRAEGRRVLVVGMGISGIESALFLVRSGIQVVCVEREDEARYRARSLYAARIAELEAVGVAVLFGVDGEGVDPFVDGVALAVVSPGISPESAIVGALRRREIPRVGEFEVGIEVSALPTVAVTGSNGKTTTVHLLHRILTEGGVSAKLCGNVGTPVVSGATTLDGSGGGGWLVAEASSYQLESCSVIRPKVGVFLNLSDNHLERHGSLERYFESKRRLFVRQRAGDVAVINRDDQWGRRLAGSIEAPVLWFGHTLASTEEGALVEYSPGEGLDRITARMDGRTRRYDLRGGRLRGVHNRMNAAACLLAAGKVGVDPDSVEGSIRGFGGLPHRIEVVRVVNGTTWINDSKSTTVAATRVALDTVLAEWPAARIHLLIGGQAKAGSWGPVTVRAREAKDRLAPILCFGGDGGLLADHCKAQGVSYLVAPTLEDAVQIAKQEAGPGDVVLLSPGCASFDAFRSFEERGGAFVAAINQCVPAC
jgi:UDP-N-acetylmuramoylalanine--D-glutamate ligase